MVTPIRSPTIPGRTMPEPEVPRDVTQPAPRLQGTESLPAHHDPTSGGPPPGSPPGTPARIGRYEIRAVLGTGAFGRVYRAFDTELLRDVAIKVPLQSGLSAEFRERFLREARAAATIRHPNVCPIYDVGSDGELPFIVMHFVHGGTLSGMIARRKEPFPPKQAAIVIRKLAMGVAAAHAKGVIHRDLKPQNVLVDEDSDTREVLITDFGLARLGSEAQMTAEGVTLGTPLYMAPEQAHGKQAVVGPLSDVYSLGVMLYQLLTGETPFSGSVLEILAQKQFTDPQPPAAARPGVDSRISELCLRAMAREPGQRFPSARALADALEAYLRGAPAAGPGGRFPAPGQPLPPGQKEPFSLDDPPAAPDPDDDVLPFAEEEVSGTEVLVCPGCRARLQVKAGRTLPIQCLRCARQFPVEAGRAAAVVPVAAPVPKPAPGPKTEPQPKLKEPPAEKVKPRRRSRVFRVGCLTLVLGALAVVGFVYQDELIHWAETVQPKPVEFALEREFQPGADEARVYGFIPGEPVLLLTNADNKDVVATVWNVAAGKRLYVLRNCPAGSGARLEPDHLRFRVRPDRVAVFHRDALANDRGSVWVYDLPKTDAKADALKDAPELTPHELKQPQRAWDISRDQKWAIGPPGGGKVKLWELGGGNAVELAVEGTTFRAVAFSPDSKWLVALDDESRLWMWNLEKGVVVKKAEKTTRLAVRPDWAGANTADLLFDPGFTRVTVQTELRIGVWDPTDGHVVEPMKRTADGEVLRDGYRLRSQTGGKGTFSVFHDDHTLRASKLTLPGDGEVSSWKLSDDRSLLAVSSRRSVTIWRLKYPAR
jgi:hypothetical protein